MSSTLFYHSCDDQGLTSTRTESAVATFQLTAETNIDATPDAIQSVVIKALTRRIVETVTQNYCGGRRLAAHNLELSSVSGKVSDFREVGSCVITNRKSRSCSTYEGAVTIVYAPLDQNPSTDEVIGSALLAIKTSMNTTSFLESLNASMDDSADFVVTKVAYAGSHAFSQQTPTVFAASDSGSYVDKSSSLNPLGISMVAFVGVLAAAIFLLTCVIFRNRSLGRKLGTAVVDGETNRSHNSDELWSETDSVIQDQCSEGDIDLDGIGKLQISQAVTSDPTSDGGHFLREKNSLVYDRVLDSDVVEGDIPHELFESTNKTERKAKRDAFTYEKQNSRRLHFLNSLSRPMWAVPKRKPTPCAEIVDHPNADEEDGRAQTLMHKMDEIIANKVPTQAKVEFLRLQ
jgi:hypothetical protein